MTLGQRGPGRPRKDASRGAEAVARSANTRGANSRRAHKREIPADHKRSALFVDPALWPPGYTYRWIRLAANGQQDNKNWGERVRQGWKPVPRDRHPDIFPVLPMPGVGDKSDGCIIYGDLCLCECPTVDVQAERDHVQQLTEDSMNVLDGFVEGGTQTAPRFNESGELQRVHRAAINQKAAFKDDPVAEE